MAAYRNGSAGLDAAKYDANFVQFLVNEGIRRSVAEQVSDGLGIKTTVCAMSLSGPPDTAGLELTDDDRTNMNLLLNLVMRYQMPMVKDGEVWQFWYGVDLTTLLQHNDMETAAATDLGALGIATLSDLGRLTLIDLSSLRWAETAKKIVWRLSVMVRRFPDKRTRFPCGPRAPAAGGPGAGGHGPGQLAQMRGLLGEMRGLASEAGEAGEADAKKTARNG